MKRLNLRKIRVVLRRSPITKAIITALLLLPAIPILVVLVSEPVDDVITSEYMATKFVSLILFAAEILLTNVAYKQHLLIDSIYHEDEEVKEVEQ